MTQENPHPFSYLQEPLSGNARKAFDTEHQRLSELFGLPVFSEDLQPRAAEVATILARIEAMKHDSLGEALMDIKANIYVETQTPLEELRRLQEASQMLKSGLQERRIPNQVTTPDGLIQARLGVSIVKNEPRLAARIDDKARDAVTHYRELKRDGEDVPVWAFGYLPWSLVLLIPTFIVGKMAYPEEVLIYEEAMEEVIEEVRDVMHHAYSSENGGEEEIGWLPEGRSKEKIRED